MGKLPGIDHKQAIRAFESAGYEVIRQSGHVVMSDGKRTLVTPRNHPVNAFTMYGIVKDSGLSIEQFRALL